MAQTEKEVFGDDMAMRMNYSMYKVASELQGKKPAPPAVWLCFQIAMLIDKDLLDANEFKDAEDALNQLGWESYKNEKGQVCLRPFV